MASTVSEDPIVSEPLLPLKRPFSVQSLSSIAYSTTTTNSYQMLHRGQMHHNQLGTINGCYVPCLLNIMGIVLFERLGWGIGQVGIKNVLLIYIFAELAAILTVLSLSAIVTNGNMKGGGSYYMISRTLGAEFGGSVGILFYCAYAVNIAFCCSGCAEEIIKTWYQDDRYLDEWELNLIFSSSILFLCLCVALLGARIFTKVNIFLFIIIFIAIMLSIFAGFCRGQFVLPDYTESGYIHKKWNGKQLKENWTNGCPNCNTVHMVFGVLFSGVTGLMEGANLSGDLANPQKSIPMGTLSAIGTAICVYLFMIVSFGGSFEANILRTVTTIPQNVSWGYIGYYLSIMGVLISSSSSALGSLFGGSRVLQAIARDKIFPKIFNKLGYGTVKGDEPMIAVIITWLISQSLLFIGGINQIAPIATSFFCLSYSTVNLCCLLLCISGQTNFRPTFKYFSKWTALLGFIMNIFIMFYVDFKFAAVSLFFEILIFIYLVYRNAKSKNDWGAVGRSVIFHQIRKYLLKLNTKNWEHSKLWRPQILLFVDNHEIALVDFCNSLKKGGIYIIGSVLNAHCLDKYSDLNKEWISFIHRNRIKAFPQISMAPNGIQQLLGYQNLLSLAGLGPMKPNTVVLPLCKLEIDRKRTLDRDRKLSAYDKMENEYIGSDQDEKIVFDSPNLMDYSDYMELLKNILAMQKNIVLTHNFEYFNYNLIVSKAIKSKFNVTSITPNEKAYISPLFAPQNVLDADKRKKRKKLILPDTTDNKWIDVWIFVEKYSFDIYDIENKADKLESNFDFVFPMLLVQFAHILSINKVWKTNANVRILLLCPKYECNQDGKWINIDKKNKFDEILSKLRLSRYVTKIEIVILPSNDDTNNRNKTIISDILGTRKIILTELKDIEDSNEEEVKYDNNYNDDNNIINIQRMSKYYNDINDIILNNSDETYFTFISLPDFNTTANEKIYIENLHILTENLPPTALVKCGQLIPVISLDI